MTEGYLESPALCKFWLNESRQSGSIKRKDKNTAALVSLSWVYLNHPSTAWEKQANKQTK